jgi:hypothetical protein
MKEIKETQRTVAANPIDPLPAWNTLFVAAPTNMLPPIDREVAALIVCGVSYPNCTSQFEKNSVNHRPCSAVNSLRQRPTLPSKT